MNTDPKRSAEPCGCDEGATYICTEHLAQTNRAGGDQRETATSYMIDHGLAVGFRPVGARDKYPLNNRKLFPDNAQGRKDHPVFTGVLMYFPDALAAVARVSKMGNDQHNPGMPLHWARGKSTDQMDTATRHMMDHGVGTTRDTDGMYHLAKAAWRVLAELQLTIEREREGR